MTEYNKMGIVVLLNGNRIPTHVMMHDNFTAVTTFGTFSKVPNGDCSPRWAALADRRIGIVIFESESDYRAAVGRGALGLNIKTVQKTSGVGKSF